MNRRKPVKKGFIMEDHSAMGQTVRDYVINQAGNCQNLSEMEKAIRQFLFSIGNIILQLWLFALKMRYPMSEKSCPHCGKSCRYHSKRWGQLHTLFGVVRYQRAYYLCRNLYLPPKKGLGDFEYEMADKRQKKYFRFGCPHLFAAVWRNKKRFLLGMGCMENLSISEH